MSGGTFRIATIAGIPIQVHPTWLVAFFLIAWTLSAGYYPSGYPGWGAGAYWVAGAASALCLFASVLVHELAHSLVAMAKGLPVSSITLFIFGGVSAIKLEGHNAATEFLVAVVGPLTSVALAALFWVATGAAPEGSAASAILGYLAFINLFLALFNLVPGFPLDGGRVLRSLVWAMSGDFARSTRIAANAGQLVAFLLIVWGVIQIFSGNVLGGLWIAFIGWFLNGAAEASRRDVVTQELFAGVTVASLMDTDPEWVLPETPVQEFVWDHALQRGLRAVPVCAGGRLLGIVSVTDAKTVPPDAWAATTVGTIMTRPPLLCVAPRAGVGEALQMLADNQVHQVLVVEGDRLVGMLNRSHVLEHLQLRQELGVRGRR